MRIGFDLDGVITEISIESWMFLDTIEDEERKKLIKEYLHFTPKLKYHPQEFLHEGDEYVIITARETQYRHLTEEWLKRYGIQTSSIFYVNKGRIVDYANVDDFFNEIAKGKAYYIKSECLDVYFEDSPILVSKIRKLCPKVQIVQVGRRIR